MRKIKPVLSLLYISAILSGCSSFRGSVPVYKNGDLIYSGNNESFRYIEASFSKIDSLITHEENFVLYLSKEGCSSCVSFKPIIEGYINDTKQSIYKYEITNQDFVNDFVPKYKDYFFPLGEIVTPSIYVCNKKDYPDQISHNTFQTKLLFTNAMKAKLYETEVYTFTDFNCVKNFINTEDEGFIYLYDRNNTNQYNAYKQFAESFIQKTNKKSAIFDISALNEDELNDISTYFNCQDYNVLNLYKIKEQKIISAHIVDDYVEKIY